jgi:hypothetical protein
MENKNKISTKLIILALSTLLIISASVTTFLLLNKNSDNSKQNNIVKNESNIATENQVELNKIKEGILKVSSSLRSVDSLGLLTYSDEAQGLILLKSTDLFELDSTAECLNQSECETVDLARKNNVKNIKDYLLASQDFKECTVTNPCGYDFESEFYSTYKNNNTLCQLNKDPNLTYTGTIACISNIDTNKFNQDVAKMKPLYAQFIKAKGLTEEDRSGMIEYPGEEISNESSKYPGYGFNNSSYIAISGTGGAPICFWKTPTLDWQFTEFCGNYGYFKCQEVASQSAEFKKAFYDYKCENDSSSEATIGNYFNL